MTTKMIKQESSIPVQSRVSIISLAEIAKYWGTTEHDIKSMSQLVSWSLDLLRDILKSNDMISKDIESVIEARDYLVNNNLWQHKVAKRAFVKLGNAIRFEGFRAKGEDPETRDEMSKVGHNLMHNKHSIEPYEDKVSARRKLVDRATKIYNELEASGEEIEPIVRRSQEDVRSRYFKTLVEVKSEHPGISEDEAKAMTQAKLKGETFVPEPGSVVKEGMNDEEYAAKMKEIKGRDLERIELEQSAVISEDDIVK